MVRCLSYFFDTLPGTISDRMRFPLWIKAKSSIGTTIEMLLTSEFRTGPWDNRYNRSFIDHDPFSMLKHSDWQAAC